MTLFTRGEHACRAVYGTCSYGVVSERTRLDVQRLEQLQAKLCHLSDAQQVRVADCGGEDRARL
eukprot:1158238-Pleurochrysis_carterae.AAC.1